MHGHRLPEGREPVKFIYLALNENDLVPSLDRMRRPLHRPARSNGWSEGRRFMAAAPKREGRRTRAEQRATTVKTILDSAEDLFSQLGLFGGTIKDVADRMGIHPALIHYYFDGKKALFDAVFERRVEYAITTRTAGLDAYETEAGDHPTVEGALRAYYDG